VAPVLTFAYPGDLDTLTGGYLYDKHIIHELENLGWTVKRLSLGDAFPFSDAAALAAAADQLAIVPADSLLVIDGLALGAIGPLAKVFARRTGAAVTGCASAPISRGFVALVHHPLGLESGLSPEQSTALLASEAQALAHARHVIVNSPTTAATLESLFAIGPDRVSIVVPGTERPALDTQASHNDGEVSCREHSASPILLSVGSIIARKGYDVLVQALASLQTLDWELRIVGDPDRDPIVFEALTTQITRLGMSDRIRLLGALEPSALEHQYAQADLFVLASHYEGYGMAYAQAIARGLPVIGTTGGATAQTVAPGTGILVEPGDVESLSKAIAQLLSHPEQRQKIAQASRKHAHELPSWIESARRFSESLIKSDTQPAAPDPAQTCSH